MAGVARAPDDAGDSKPIENYFKSVKLSIVGLHITYHLIGVYNLIYPDVITMNHARSLRVIGQALDVGSVRSFELEKERHAQHYLLRTDPVTKTHERILRPDRDENGFIEESGRLVTDGGPLRFTPFNISRLDSQGQRKRRAHSSAQMRGSKNLSQLLRSLGDYLDRVKATAFHVRWTADGVSVDYQEADGVSDSRQFTLERLRQLDLHTMLRRSSRTGQGRQFVR
jgi:hypothetical protein